MDLGILDHTLIFQNVTDLGILDLKEHFHFHFIMLPSIDAPVLMVIFGAGVILIQSCLMKFFKILMFYPIPS